MEIHHIILAALAITGFCHGTMPDSRCEPCISVDPLPGQTLDQWVGHYSFKEVTDNCPNKCSYTRADTPDTVYCFGAGPRTGEYTCPVTDITPGVSDTTEDGSNTMD